MKKLNLSFLILFIVIGLSCNENHKNELLTISFDKNISNEKVIGLKEIAKEIEYVKLERNSECLLGSVNDLVASEKYFFVGSEEVFQFLRNGRFVRKIGKKGRGPGEYTGVLDMAIDESSQRIYILTSEDRKILIFDFKGTFLNSIQLRDRFIQTFDLLDKDNIVLQSGINPYSLVSTEIINEKGESVVQLNSRVYKTIDPNIDGKLFNVTYEYKKELFVKESRNDTVYKITNNGLLPYYVYDLGKYKPPIICSEDEWSSYAIIYRIFETANHIFTFFAHDRNICVAQYNKSTKEVRVSIPLIDNKEGIKNDFDNGVNFYMTFWTKYKTNQNEWILPINPTSLSAFKNDSNITGNFKSLINQYDENDNPIIMIIILK
jgi:hypothetical protein